MTPSADSASTSATARPTLAEELLEDGEVVVLAVKPSGWFVMLVSLPVLAAAAGLAAAAYLIGELAGANLHYQAVLAACLAGAMGRILIACFQWMGQLYVLTNLRVIRIRGVVRMDVFHHPLKQLTGTSLSASPAERAVGVASLHFDSAENLGPGTVWLHVARPVELRQIVDDAIAKAG